MSMLDGVLQCWPLGPTCEAWWDAYAASASVASAAIAVGALLVAWMGVGVTAASALAVWQLGVRANQLAIGAQEIAQRQRLDEERRVAEERDREEVIILCYLASEITSLTAQLESLEEKTRIGGNFDLRALLASPDLQSRLRNDGDYSLGTDRIISVLPRLHAVRPEIGLRCARLAGDCAEIELLAKRISHDSRLYPRLKERADADLTHHFEFLREYIERSFDSSVGLQALVVEAGDRVPKR
ncbi:TPA: hypothetical protein QEK92_001854 [Stenotrophomonas maltophilia]|nr:hypothetical protein [Stenotrophomonas maltophilia]HDS1541258.1 hypothetical protein [Stenotrophomonas maltophilia]